MPSTRPQTVMSLDQLYKMVARIYGEQNANRSPVATFSHFVEVCGMLTMWDRKKKREGGSFEDALCRALGWYFPLMARFRIESVEELIFRKFPYVCPYCRQAPHQDGPCKTVRGTSATVDHGAVLKAYDDNKDKRPTSLNGWQNMFQDIYPRNTSEGGRSTIGLMEELGELAEAIRVYDRHPKYLLGEAADTFSYLMGLANEYQLSAQMEGRDFSFEDEFIKRYPGLCPQCGYTVCVCPSVPDSTVGRMAKELDVFDTSSIFVTDPEAFAKAGKQASLMAIEGAGGYEGLASTFPFDRGDANKGLIMLCLRLADALDVTEPDTASRLRSAAMRVGSHAAYAGSPSHDFDDKAVLTAIRDAWREVGDSVKSDLDGDLAESLGTMLGKVRILFVGASPREADQIHVNEEHRAIKEAIELSEGRSRVHMTYLTAPTIDDVRRALLRSTYEVIHFSGHGNESSFLLHGSSGSAAEVSLKEIQSLIDRQDSVACVVLNSCHSAANLSTAIGPLTVAMDDEILDEAAIEFSRGFYDAIGAGKSAKFAVQEGIAAAKLKGLSTPNIVVKERNDI